MIRARALRSHDLEFLDEFIAIEFMTRIPPSRLINASALIKRDFPIKFALDAGIAEIRFRKDDRELSPDRIAHRWMDHRSHVQAAEKILARSNPSKLLASQLIASRETARGGRETGV